MLQPLHVLLQLALDPLISDSSVSSSFIYKNKSFQLHSAIHSDAPGTSHTSAACP